MESPTTGWWSSATRRIHRMLGRERTAPTSDSETVVSLGPEIGDSLTWLQRVTEDPLVRDVIREHYGRRADGQHLEFLMACTSFEAARNPLQRFEQLRHIIHRFVHPGSARAVGLPDPLRTKLLQEWARWSDGNRVPVGHGLPALDAAARNVRLQVAEQRRG